MTDPFSIREDKIKDSFLSRDLRLTWTEEMFDDPGDENMKVERSSSQFLGSAISSRKIKIFSLIIFLALGLFFARSFYLQVVRGEYYHGLAEGNRIRILPIKASRGVIFDSQGQQLVKNIASFNLLITPADLPDDESDKNKILKQVAELAEILVAEIEEKIKAQQPYIYQPILIKSGLNYQQIIDITIKERELPSVSLEEGWRREYLFSDEEEIVDSLSHILGYPGQLTREEYREKSELGYFLNDVVGKTGLELVYEKELKGENGKKQIEVDALGKEKQIIAQNQPVAGKDLTLSLNYNLQKKAEQALTKTLRTFNKSRGAVVVLNPQNGEILALVSWPSYSSNDFVNDLSSEEYSSLVADSDKPLFNRAIAGAYPSGSTIKPVMAIAALAEGIITPRTSFNSVGGIQIQQWFFPDWKAGGHGLTNVYKAIAESVNTFFYMIGGGFPQEGNPTKEYEFEGLGPYKIAQWLEKFGLGKKSNIDLNSEAKGFIPTVEWKNQTYGEKWYIGDTYNLAIGQGNLLVTPLQVANWTAAIANNGTLYWPHLVKKIGSAEVGTRVIRSNIAAVDDLTVVQEAMRQTVTSGSASSFFDLPIAVAAKTGTAQWSNIKEPHAWFTCFAPYQNPELAVTVLIEEGEEGSRTAAAVAKEILYYYATEFQN